MGEPLPWLIEGSVKIALDFLKRSGEVRNPGKPTAFFNQQSTA